MQARRGYIPKDDRYFSEVALPVLGRAAHDIAYLINHGYGLTQATTFVGDHFQLAERQRMALMRVVATDADLAARRSKEVPLGLLAGTEVSVDGLNAIITLEVMLCGSPLLRAMDTCVRDLASLHGTYRIIEETEGAIRLMLDTLVAARVRTARFYLDAPVSNSGRLCSLIRETGATYPIGIKAELVPDPDRVLFGKERVVSSDSVVLDHSRSWLNLTGHIADELGAPVICIL